MDVCKRKHFRNDVTHNVVRYNESWKWKILFVVLISFLFITVHQLSPVQLFKSLDKKETPSSKPILKVSGNTAHQCGVFCKWFGKLCVHGECEDSKPCTYSYCKCDEGYTGPHCDEKIKLVETTPSSGSVA